MADSRNPCRSDGSAPHNPDTQQRDSTMVQIIESVKLAKDRSGNMKWMKYWMRHAPWAAALAALILIAETDASATNQEPTSWWVDIDVDHAADTMRSAYSPLAAEPEALADTEGDFRSVIRYLCLNAKEREMGIVAPAHLVFREHPRPTARAVPGSIMTEPLKLRTTWGDETVVLQAVAVPVRNRIYLDRDDAKDRGTGKSSDTEFVRRLLESPSTASDSLVIELDWEEVGAVRYAYSLEGAASAIREAGQPCVGSGRMSWYLPRVADGLRRADPTTFAPVSVSVDCDSTSRDPNQVGVHNGQLFDHGSSELPSPAGAGDALTSA